MAKNRGGAKSVDKWERRLARQAASGQTVARFCAREGISVASFYYQLRKRRGQSAGSVSARASGERGRTRRSMRTAAQSGRVAATSLFRQLQVTNGPAIAQRVKVRLPNGAELSFARDPELVRQVLDQLLCSASSPSGDRSC